jgi:hypothetical protein
MKLAPIVLFVYNRPWHTQQTVEALKKNKLAKDSILYIFSDGPKNKEDKEKVGKVRKYIKSIEGFKERKIKEREKNLGLANSVISGVTEVINKCGKVIVLEDDLVTSPVFLNYMNNYLIKYKKILKIWCITGFNYPKSLLKIPKDYKKNIYIAPRVSSWGWGTWIDRWKKVDWNIEKFRNILKNKKTIKKLNSGGNDQKIILQKQLKGEVDSWAMIWNIFRFKNKAYCIYPINSLVDNIGFDNSGVHCGRSNKYKNNVNNYLINLQINNDIEPDVRITKQIKRINNRKVKSYIKNFLKRLSLI